MLLFKALEIGAFEVAENSIFLGAQVGPLENSIFSRRRFPESSRTSPIVLLHILCACSVWDARTLHAAITFPRRRHIQLACDIDEDAGLCVSASQGCLGDGCTAAVRTPTRSSLCTAPLPT